MESTVSRLSKGGKYPSFTAAEIASSTRWLRGMKAGLAARIAARRSFASPPSSASRWRHLIAQSSKELGSVNKLRTPASPSGLAAALHILIAQGRNAADVPPTNTFGPATLSGFRVWADEVPPE